MLGGLRGREKDKVGCAVAFFNRKTDFGLQRGDGN